MELIPYILQVIFYIILLLVFVLLVSFVFSKRELNKNNNSPYIIAEKRKHMRTYIETTSREMTSSGGKQSTLLRTSIYKAPKSVENKQQTSAKRIRNDFNDNESMEKKRYTIVNNSTNNSAEQINNLLDNSYKNRNKFRHFVN